MHSISRTILASVAALVLAPLSVGAQTQSEAPIIEFKTTLYENAGAANAFHFVIGAKEDTYIDVDYGYGKTEVEVGQAVFDADSQSIIGTTVTGSVGSAGVVKIYGDASLIDYLELDGIYITDLSFPTLTEVEILNLDHNELRALDLSHMTKLQALYISDNPFDESPLVVGANKPDLTIIDMSLLGALDESFNFSDYPSLASAQVWSVPSLTRADTSGCPDLLQLSIDVTNVSSVDLSNNPNLLILNVSDTKICSLDLSHNQYITELYIGHNGSINSEYKFKSIDLSGLPNLQRFSGPGNALTTLDLSHNPKLLSLSVQHNLLSGINFENNQMLNLVDISFNNMDFATIPADRSSFSDYIYGQNPFPVERQYAVGSVIDLSERVLRPNSTTDAALYTFNRENPNVAALLSDEYYSYADGRITLLKSLPDSVYVAYKNSALPDAVLVTENFMVKEPGEIGKPAPAATVNFSAAQRQLSFKVGVAGATPAKPVTFQVDFGDGVLIDCAATSDSVPDAPNVVGTRMGASTIIYMPEGVQLTALGIADHRVMTVNLDNAMELKYLSLTGCRLSAIATPWNRRLASLDLSNNALTALDLTGYSAFYSKNSLQSVIAPGNKIAEFVYEEGRSFVDINLSGNALSNFPLDKMSHLKSLDLSDNQLASVDLRDCEALRSADLSGNYLSEIVILDYLPLESLDLSENNFTFMALPAVGAIANYTYAPQRIVTLPTKAPVISLAAYLFEGEGGVNTTYTWKMADSGLDAPGDDIRDVNGRFFFDNPDLGKIYCEMTNPAFPDFAGDNVLKTSVVETAPMPTHVVASYTPTVDGQVNLVLAAVADNITVYLDWSGLGDFQQLILKDVYQVFTLPAMEGREARLYSYDDDGGLSVFSIDGVTMSSLDVSPLKKLIMLGVNEAGLTEDQISFPDSPSLIEISLGSNRLSNIDFMSAYPSLKMISVNDNPLGSLDVTSFKSLEALYASFCDLTHVDLDNPAMWVLDLIGNKLETIDLSHLPSLEQLVLSHNNFASIDLTPLDKLREVLIDNNRFTFATLPIPQGRYYTYNYYNQLPLDVEAVAGVVDLSSQAAVGSTPTTFRWFIDSPYLDEAGELYGEELIEGVEYTIENGVTTFLNNFSHIMCVMTNDVFPNLYLTTNFIDVQSASLTAPQADSGAPVEYFNLQGLRVTNPTSGIYIRRQGSATTKVAIP